MMLLGGGSPRLSSWIEERRRPTNGNKDRLDPLPEQEESINRYTATLRCPMKCCP
ncbi:hypothetical protein K443DRAFT_318580 [Laccaria amethystina LaAM-08-1]|uniref:Uncharacterized protein n=1 Tax=Laccaria amethystina LaAM-08-1 TaxID=1095629 RepID=A0A0C9XLP6_9AGAR|nr:hypothetical protein K443DRAFT_318580 [Laccaria amethystina LaAM-08-1]